MARNEGEESDSSDDVIKIQDRFMPVRSGVGTTMGLQKNILGVIEESNYYKGLRYYFVFMAYISGHSSVHDILREIKHNVTHLGSVILLLLIYRTISDSI